MNNNYFCVIMKEDKCPKVSVLMLTYNQQAFIGQAIMSVVNQQVDFRYEIVIADDCSQDDTPEICKRLASRYPSLIKLHLRKKNMGLIPNFLDAYSCCRGKYIAICEGDDYWTSSHKLMRQVSFLDAHPDFTIAFHRVINHYIDHGTWSLSNGGSRRITTVSELSRSNYISNVSAMFRHIPVEDLPEWFSRVSTYDYPLHMLNAARGKIYYDKRPMAVYRQHLRAIWSQAGAVRKLDMARSVRELMIDHFNSSGLTCAADGLRVAHKAICISMIKADIGNRLTYEKYLLEYNPGVSGDEVESLINSPAPRQKITARILTGGRKFVSRLVPVALIAKLFS